MVKKNSLKLSEGYITKNALKSPQGIESRHSTHHSTRLDELFQMIYRTCDHVLGRKKKCQRLYELTIVKIKFGFGKRVGKTTHSEW